ncbi:MAG: DNA polymerase I, partial [Candidatus Omnitrophica bacterium]|nr:DNA polymerase I [Candidatus Omnitrophota bacterium]
IGIKIDREKLKKLSVEVGKRLVKLVSLIYELAGSEFNINSPKQLGDVLFNRLKLPVFKKTKTGPSTDEEVLRSLSARHALPQKLLEYRQLMKLKNTYIDTLPELADARTDRVHTVFNQTGTETGRLSSSKPNLQNIPIKTDLGRRIRESVISFSKRNFLLSCDYSQIELRIMAHMSQDIILLDAFKLDKDIHKATAALIHDCDEQEVDEKMRDVAKRINFGIIYGLSAFGLSRDLGVPHEQAQMFIDAYFSRYAGVKDYIERQIAQAEEDGFVSTLFGRRRYLPEIRNKNQAMRQLAQRQAINTPLQGTASDIIKKAMIDIYFQITKHKLSGKMILQIHDELLFDIPNKDLADFSGMVKEKMENVCKLSVPIRVVMKAGNNWSEMSEL